MLNTIKKEHVITAIFIFLVVAVGYYFWYSSNKWTPLYTNLEELASAKISKKLEELKIPFKVDNSGNILVESSDKSNIKLQVASEKIVATEAVGLEIFNDLDYGMTEFSQKVHYQRALQGELARSIMNIGGIKFARVHLSIPEKRLFKNDQRKASAAISLSGTDISNVKLNSIKELVAASIEGLSTEDVVITDSEGNVFNAKESLTGTMSTKLEHKALYEKDIERKISNILSTIINPEQYNLSVNVELNYNKINQTNNDFLHADKNIILKKTITGNKKSSKSENIEYGYGTKVESIEYSVGEIEKVTAGVIIIKPINEEVISSLKELLIASIGIDAERGDTLSIVSLPSSALSKSQIISKPIVQASIDVSSGGTVESINDSNADSDNNALPIAPKKVSTMEPSVVSKPQMQNKKYTTINKSRSILDHSIFDKQNLLISLGVLLLILIISIIALRPKRLSNNKREKLLQDIQGWLKE